MGFLNKTLSDLSMESLMSLIRREVTSQIPPIPAGVATLADEDVPLVPPDPSTVTDGNVLVFNTDTGAYSADTIKARSLEAVLVLTTSLLAGTAGASRIELGVASDGSGDIGLKAYAADGTSVTFTIDADTGAVYMKGRLDFGTASRLLSNDIIEMQVQGSATFQVPARVQNASKTPEGTNLSTASVSWDSPTTTGNTLFLAVTSRCHNSNTPVAPDAPSGWTLLRSDSQNFLRHTVYYKLNSPSRSGPQTITWTGTSHVDAAVIEMIEVSGIDSLDVNAAISKGNSTAPASSATGTLAQAGEYVISFTGINDLGSDPGAPSGGLSKYSFGTAETSTGGSPIVVESVAQAVADLSTLATTTITTGYTIGAAKDWINFTATFKALATGPVPAGDSGKARMYAATTTGGKAVLGSVGDDGSTGTVALGPSGTRYSLEYQEATFAIGSVVAGGSTTQNVTLTNLAVGDLAFWMGTVSTTALALNTRSVCATTNTIVLNIHNTDDGAGHSLASQAHSFLIVHRA